MRNEDIGAIVLIILFIPWVVTTVYFRVKEKIKNKRISNTVDGYPFSRSEFNKMYWALDQRITKRTTEKELSKIFGNPKFDPTLTGTKEPKEILIATALYIYGRRFNNIKNGDPDIIDLYNNNKDLIEIVKWMYDNRF